MRFSIKKIITISIIVGITLLPFSSVLAADCKDLTLTEQFNQFLQWVIALLSRLRIPLAIFAGKLMNNGFLYGEFLNLDKVLYFLWNISRTFANFLVVVLIIWELIKQFTSGWIDGPKIMKHILKLWAGIFLANMSRFLIGATVDISTILTSTVASLPSSYLAQDDSTRENIILAMQNAQWQSKLTLHLNTKQCDKNEIITQEKKPTDTVKTEAELMDMIVPTENSISWPLMYLWIGVLKLQNLSSTISIPEKITGALFIVFTRIGIILLFVIALIVLIIVNIFRILALRFFVAFAPLIIMLWITDNDKSYQIGILEKFTIPNIIKSIFAPVVTVWLMSISLIVISIMQSMLQPTTQSFTIDDLGIKNSPQWSTIGVDNLFSTTVNGNLFWDNTGNQIKNVFSDLLLTIFTLFILYGVISALRSFLKDGIWGSYIDQLVGLWGKTLWALPMIPTPWWGKTSFSAIGKQIEKRINTAQRSLSNTSQDNALQNSINKMFWLPQQMDRSITDPLVKYSKQLGKQNYSINKNDIDNFFKEYKPIKEFYLQDDQRKIQIPLSQMAWINETLPTLLNKIWQSKKYTTSDDKNLTNINIWEKRDDQAIEKWIDEIYNKTTDNKTMLKDIYSRLWWDSTTLNKGEEFWTKGFKRKSWTQKTTETTSDSKEDTNKN